MLAISPHRRLQQEDTEFKTSLGYIIREQKHKLTIFYIIRNLITAHIYWLIAIYKVYVSQLHINDFYFFIIISLSLGDVSCEKWSQSLNPDLLTLVPILLTTRFYCPHAMTTPWMRGFCGPYVGRAWRDALLQSWHWIRKLPHRSGTRPKPMSILINSTF